MTPASEIRVYAAGLIVAVLALFALDAFAVHALDRADARYARLARVHAADQRRWQTIADKCDMNTVGEMHCPAGVVATTSSTSTTIKEAR